MHGSISPHEAPPALTARFADFASSLVPQGEVAEVARNILTDWLGVAIAGGAAAPLSPLFDLLAEDGGRPEASVFGRPLRLPAQAAALLNGAASEVHDYDDTYYPMYGHPSAAPVGTALALAERTGASGADLLAAVAVGAELSCRLGRLVGYGPYLRGLSPTGTSGAVAAAAAGARVLGLEATTTARALSLGAGQAAGLHANGSTSAMQVQAGRAAGAGVLAALLAQRGLSAHGHVLEAPRGFVDSRGGLPDWGAGVDGLGRDFAIRDIYFKFAASCGGTQPTIDAVRQLAPAVATGGGAARIVIRISQTVRTLCRADIPAIGYDAKFSLPFCAAGVLLGIDLGALDSFDEAVIARPDVAALRARVVVEVDPDLGEWQAEVVILTATGQTLGAGADIPASGPAPEVLAPRIRAKFVSLARPVIGAARAEAALKVLANIEERPAQDLFDALAAG